MARLYAREKQHARAQTSLSRTLSIGYCVVLAGTVSHTAHQKLRVMDIANKYFRLLSHYK